MLNIKCINQGKSQSTYKVEGNIMLYTEKEIADKCYYNCWGYRVIYSNSYEMEIIVYTD